MKAPVTTMNGWVMGKVISFLKEKEGFHVERVEYTAQGIRGIIRDTFGFRYEINMETIGRLADSPIVDTEIQQQVVERA